MTFSPWNLEVLWMLALPLCGSIAFGVIAGLAESTSAERQTHQDFVNLPTAWSNCGTRPPNK